MNSSTLLCHIKKVFPSTQRWSQTLCEFYGVFIWQNNVPTCKNIEPLPVLVSSMCWMPQNIEYVQVQSVYILHNILEGIFYLYSWYINKCIVFLQKHMKFNVIFVFAFVSM